MNKRDVSHHGKTATKLPSGLPALGTKAQQQFTNHQLPINPSRKYQRTVDQNLSPKSFENPYSSSPMKVTHSQLDNQSNATVDIFVRDTSNLLMNKTNYLMSQIDPQDTGERIQPIFKDTESSDDKSEEKNKYFVEDEVDEEFLQEVADIKNMMAQMGTNLE